MTNAPALMNQDGRPMMPVHSPLYALGVSKRLFLASTSLSGVTIPVNASGVNGVFTLENPAASNVNIELIRLHLALSGTTVAVIGGVALAYQNPLTALATTTLGTITSCQIGSGASSAANFYTAGHFTGTPSVLMHLGISFGTTADGAGPLTAISDLTGLILPPGAAITVVGNAAQTQPTALSLLFAENPIL